MLNYAGILNVILPVYLTMVLGGVVRKLGILTPEADKSLMRLVVSVLTPALILDRVVGNPNVMKPLPVLIAAGLGFSLVVIGIVIAYFAAPFLGLKKGEGRRTFGVSTGLQNYGFVAIPIIAALFSKQGTLGVLFTFSLGVELALWTAGVGLLTGLGKAPWKAVLTPPVITILISLMLNFTDLHRFEPALLDPFLGTLGDCVVPLAVLLIGASIADVWGQEPVKWSVAIAAPVLRLLVIPIAFLAAACLLPVDIQLKRILVVQAAMPSAVFNIVIARHYGGHATTAVQVVLATTVVSIVTTPFVIGWGMKLAGL
jgi:predicted permease